MELSEKHFIDLETRVAELETLMEALKGVNAYIHPSTRKAMVRHAPSMSSTEMEQVLKESWAVGQKYTNSETYAGRRFKVLDNETLAKARREIFWLKHAKHIEYLKPIRAYTII